MNKKGTGRCRDPTGPEEKTINEKKGKDDGKKEKMMEKRKKDGCETSRNRQKKETGKKESYRFAGRGRNCGSGTFDRRTYAWMQGKNPDHAGSF